MVLTLLEYVVHRGLHESFSHRLGYTSHHIYWDCSLFTSFIKDHKILIKHYEFRHDSVSRMTLSGTSISDGLKDCSTLRLYIVSAFSGVTIA